MIPGFASAERAYENQSPPDDADECASGDCDECMACLYAIAEDQAEALAEMTREERRLEERYGA